MPIGDRPPEPLSRDEVRALLEACPGDTLTGMRNRALLVMFWRCGLRCAEALALRPSDIDFGSGTVRVRFGKGRRARTVGIDAEALFVVRAWLGAAAAAGISTEFLFCTVKPGHVGYPMVPRYVRTLMTRLGEKAGVGHRVHAHGWRHTHAVELRREGWPIPEIARQLGHTSIATTQVYLDHMYPSEVIDRARARSW